MRRKIRMSTRMTEMIGVLWDEDKDDGNETRCRAPVSIYVSSGSDTWTSSKRTTFSASPLRLDSPIPTPLLKVPNVSTRSSSTFSPTPKPRPSPCPCACAAYPVNPASPPFSLSNPTSWFVPVLLLLLTLVLVWEEERCFKGGIDSFVRIDFEGYVRRYLTPSRRVP